MICLLEMLTSEGRKLKPCPPATLLLTVPKFLFPSEALSLCTVLYSTQYVPAFLSYRSALANSLQSTSPIVTCVAVLSDPSGWKLDN